jgi:hypothetical protein
MKSEITLDYLKKILYGFDYKLDSSGEFTIFWKRINQNDTRSRFAFSIVTATLHSHSLRIEGLNEARLKNEIKAGKIIIEKDEDIEKYKQVIFETTLDSRGKLETILNFFEQQIKIIGTDPIYTDNYKIALNNIELIVDAANQVDMED